MKRLGIFLLSAMAVHMAVARPILNLNGRGNAPVWIVGQDNLPIRVNPLLRVRIWM